MGIGSRPSACAQCNKRLGRKHWYYRNGKYFCTKQCFETARAKAGETAGAAEGSTAPSAEQAENAATAKKAEKAEKS